MCDASNYEDDCAIRRCEDDYYTNILPNIPWKDLQNLKDYNDSEEVLEGHCLPMTLDNAETRTKDTINYFNNEERDQELYVLEAKEREGIIAKTMARAIKELVRATVHLQALSTVRRFVKTIIHAQNVTYIPNEYTSFEDIERANIPLISITGPGMVLWVDNTVKQFKDMLIITVNGSVTMDGQEFLSSCSHCG